VTGESSLRGGRQGGQVATRRVVRKLVDAGCTKVADDGRSAKWRCPCGFHAAPVPQHAVLSAGVVRGLTNYLPCLPEGWWR